MTLPLMIYYCQTNKKMYITFYASIEESITKFCLCGQTMQFTMERSKEIITQKWQQLNS